jgi:hypothetical protein
MPIIASHCLDALRVEARLTKTASAAFLLSESSVSMSGYFDTFLSHSYADAQSLAGPDILRTKRLLERFSFSVYVDWIVDPELDRVRVTPRNASILHRRLGCSGSLLFVTSATASASTWMPRELR